MRNEERTLLFLDLHLYTVVQKVYSKVCPECGIKGKVMLLPKSKGFILCTVAILGHLGLS